MSTRQLRINDANQIRNRIREFIGKKINIVLKDQTVSLIRIEEVSDVAVNGSNMRLKTITIPFDQISEIYFDTKE
jgi:hypothetical protein